MAENWIGDTDKVDLDVEKEGLLEEPEDEEVDDDEDDEAEDQGPDSPEAQWGLAKKMHGGGSVSMDQLMALVGLRKIKASAVSVFKVGLSVGPG